jgi:hypothetical protein
MWKTGAKFEPYPSPRTQGASGPAQTDVEPGQPVQTL